MMLLKTYTFCRLTLLLILLMGGCTSVPKAFLPEAERQFSRGDPRIGTYVSSDKGFTTSSYWIEGPEGLILIDTQFLLSAAEEFVNWAEKTTGKKAVLAVVLHPNPDKFNGTEVFKKRGIRVITSEQVKSYIPAVHKLRTGWFYEKFKPDYPVQTPEIESFGSKTQEIVAAGLTVKLHVLGAGCSRAHVVAEFDRHLFPGDLVTNNYHSWLELGMLGDWIKTIEQLSDLEIDYVHPGRGPSGGNGLLYQQADYLQRVKDAFLKENLKRSANEKALERVKNRIFSSYPGYEYPRFVENGLEQTWKQLQKKN